MVAITSALPAQRADAQATAESAPDTHLVPTTDPASDDSADANQASEIERLIPLLASPQYAERIEATARLTEIGTAAYAKLHDTFHRSDDLEVKLLIEQIVRDSWLDRFVYGRIGFLGIQRKREAPPTHDDDPRILEGHTGVWVGGVIEGTGAEKAGLEVEDVIVALDGAPLKGEALIAFKAFAQSIRERGTGGKVSLTVLRGTEVVEIDATLGAVPATALTNVEGGRQLYRVGVRRMEKWWFEEFHTPPDAERGALKIPEFQPISGDE